VAIRSAQAGALYTEPRRRTWWLLGGDLLVTVACLDVSGWVITGSALRGAGLLDAARTGDGSGATHRRRPLRLDIQRARCV
jgi:hypothetical protein